MKSPEKNNAWPNHTKNIQLIWFQHRLLSAYKHKSDLEVTEVTYLSTSFRALLGIKRRCHKRSWSSRPGYDGGDRYQAMIGRIGIPKYTILKPTWSAQLLRHVIYISTMYIKCTCVQICVCMQSLPTDLCVQLEIKCNLVDISSFTDSPSSKIDLKILLSWIFLSEKRSPPFETLKIWSYPVPSSKLT